MHNLKGTHGAWPATTTEQYEGHFPFHWPEILIPTSPAFKFIAFILPEVSVLQPALHMPLGAMALTESAIT